LTVLAGYNAVSGLQHLHSSPIRRSQNPKIGHKLHAGLKSHRNIYTRVSKSWVGSEPMNNKIFIKKWIMNLTLVWWHLHVSCH